MTMDAITTITGPAALLERADVDTDQIIPAQYLKRTTRAGLGAFAFAGWQAEADFALARPRYRDAPILVTGPNFGCGSSREHAVWALHDRGVRVVIAPSLADIFRTNCGRFGVLAIELEPREWRTLRDRLAAGDDQLEVALEAQTIRASDHVWRFAIDPFVKRCLLDGLDPIGLALEHEVAIAAHEAARPSHRPRVGGRHG